MEKLKQTRDINIRNDNELAISKNQNYTKSEKLSVEDEIKRRLFFWLFTVCLSFVVGHYTYVLLTSHFFVSTVDEMPELVRDIYPYSCYIFPAFSVLTVIVYNMNFGKYTNYDFIAGILSLSSGFVGQLLGSLAFFVGCVILVVVYYAAIILFLIVIIGFFSSIFS